MARWIGARSLGPNRAHLPSLADGGRGACVGRCCSEHVNAYSRHKVSQCRFHHSDDVLDVAHTHGAFMRGAWNQRRRRNGQTTLEVHEATALTCRRLQARPRLSVRRSTSPRISDHAQDELHSSSCGWRCLCALNAVQIILPGCTMIGYLPSRLLHIFRASQAARQAAGRSQPR